MRGREVPEDVGMAEVVGPGKVGNRTRDPAASGLKRSGRTVCNSGETDGARRRAP